MSRRFRCSWILPLAQLIVCAVLLVPFRQWIADNIQAVRQHRDVFEVSMARVQRPVTSNVIGDIPIDSSEVAASARSSHSRLIAPSMLNAPAMVLTIPYAMFSADHTELYPHQMDFEVWRSITWPFIGLAFWWTGGRACDALLSLRHRAIAPRLRWFDLALACVSLISTVLTGGLAIMARSDTRMSAPLLASVCTIWAVLGLATWIARIWQWRQRRRVPL